VHFGGNSPSSVGARYSCLLDKYCNANCQKNHWTKHNNDCKNVLPNYAMRRCARTQLPTVQFASYQCRWKNSYAVCRFQKQLYHSYQYTILQHEELENMGTEHYYSFAVEKVNITSWDRNNFTAQWESCHRRWG
jgi:hypothetical protein